MAAISTIIAGVGLGIGAVSAYNSYSSGREAARANERAAQGQAQIAAIQAAGVDNLQGKLAVEKEQQLLQIRTQRDVIAAQREAEGIRMRASELDATRRRREIIRSQLVARSNSLVAATASGANSPGSTAFADASADISGRTGVNLLGVSQNLELGRRLFQVNRNISDIYLNAQQENEGLVGQSYDWQSRALENQRTVYQLGGQVSDSYRQAASAQSTASMWQGIGSLGGALVTNAQTIGRIGTYFTSPSPNPQTYGGFVNSIGSNGIY